MKILKKLIRLALTPMLALGLGVPTAAAGGDFKIENGVLKEYTGPGGSTVIPDGVTEIGEFAFAECACLTAVTIPEGVAEIGKCAFAECKRLTSVAVPAGVAKIGWGTFAECPSLTDIRFGGTREQWNALGVYCGSASVRCSDAVVFGGDFKIKNGVLKKYSGAGGHVVIPSGVAKIGREAFFGCTSLTAVTIPEGVAKIGREAFFGCTSLASVAIPEGVTGIGELAFAKCASLTEITLPAGVTKIGNVAFLSCEGLTDITLPASVTEIGDSAFSCCLSLTGITIPAGISKIGMHAFAGCESLTDIHFGGTRTHWEALHVECRHIAVHCADDAAD